MKELCLAASSTFYSSVLLPHSDSLDVRFCGVDLNRLARRLRGRAIEVRHLRRVYEASARARGFRSDDELHTFLTEFHGLWCSSFGNGTKHHSSVRDSLRALMRFARSRSRGVDGMLFYCYETKVCETFRVLLEREGDLVRSYLNIPVYVISADSCVPLLERSHSYHTKRCCFHVSFPVNIVNRHPFDCCAMAMAREVFDTNRSVLLWQVCRTLCKNGLKVVDGHEGGKEGIFGSCRRRKAVDRRHGGGGGGGARSSAEEEEEAFQVSQSWSCRCRIEKRFGGQLLLEGVDFLQRLQDACERSSRQRVDDTVRTRRKRETVNELRTSCPDHVLPSRLYKKYTQSASGRRRDTH